MKQQTSLYLDAIRICAAIAVFFSHITRESLSANNPIILFLGQFGQEGVAVFFVISGIVIAFVAKEKEHDLRSFIVARLGRLWSVVVPALILTVILDTTGRAIAPEMYSSKIKPWGWNFDSLWNFLAPLFFLNQTAFGLIDPGTNGPFWSICFEFWYYILFGIGFYLRGFSRLFLLIIAGIIAGPRILALFPIWAFGLIIYLRLKRLSISANSLGVWVLSCIALISLILFKYKVSVLLVSLFPALSLNSIDVASWISHFVVGIMCSINIAIYDNCKGLEIFHKKSVEQSIRYLAARSFSLYLYQAPCLFFFGALTYGIKSAIFRIIVIVVMSLITILVLSELTELRKKWFVSLANRIIPEKVPGLPMWTLSSQIFAK